MTKDISSFFMILTTILVLSVILVSFYYNPVSPKNNTQTNNQ